MSLHRGYDSRLLRVTVVAVFVGAFLPRPAGADERWRCTKDYTAAVMEPLETAFRALGDAYDTLSTASEVLAQARETFNAAGRPATGPVAAAVATAAAAVAEAELLVAAALDAVAVATGVVVAFYAGTCAGQGLGWVISKVVDPIAPVTLIDPVYRYPTDAEVDSWLPLLLTGSLPRPIPPEWFARMDTIQPGSGTLSWSFMRENVRGFAIGIRDGGAFSAGRCADVRQASADLDAFLPNYMTTTVNFAGLLAQTPTFAGDPVGAIEHALVELNNLKFVMSQYPEHCPNPAELTLAIDNLSNALLMCRAGFAPIEGPGGLPIPVDGVLIPPLTLGEFLAFLADCRDNGVVCLPDIERLMTDQLMVLLGAFYAGVPSVAEPIARWDGEGDTGFEAALFAPGGTLTRAQVLWTAVPNHWQRIDVRESILLLHCTPGDLNCDGFVNNFDIDPFVLAISDPQGYYLEFPMCNINNADANGDGAVNNFDIDPFVALISGE
jgi:hypothetical protein